MCGIVSIISKRPGGFWHADLELFEGLLLLDTLRGLDSTGVFCVDAARQVGLMKVASHPFHLFAAQGYASWRGRAVQSGRILVGHNRKATQGSINSRNAHPFHSGNIVLVHNGTLRGDYKKDLGNPAEVDSHALAIAFNEKGAENVIPTINGAFALIWWDIEQNRLNVIRNDERPLQIVETDESYFVLSEGWMALQLLARDGKKVKDIHDIPAGKLYSFKIGGEHEIKDVEVKKPTPVTYHTGRGVQHGGAQASSVSGGKSQTSSTETDSGSKKSEQSATTVTPTTGQKTTSPSQGQVRTALTVVKKKDSQPAAGDTDNSTGDATKLPIDMANHVACEEFIRGQSILVKFVEMKLADGGQLYFLNGKVAEPNCPDIDVAAYLKVADIEPGTAQKYVQGFVEGVVHKHTVSTCGRSVYVTKLKLPETIEVHNNRITETEWNYVTTYCKCGQCDARIYDEEQLFTSVMRRPKNQYTVTCADCIEKNLKGDAQHEFRQNRLIALQAYIGKRDTLGEHTVSGIETSGPSALH